MTATTISRLEERQAIAREITAAEEAREAYCKGPEMRAARERMSDATNEYNMASTALREALRGGPHLNEYAIGDLNGVFFDGDGDLARCAITGLYLFEGDRALDLDDGRYVLADVLAPGAVDAEKIITLETVAEDDESDGDDDAQEAS